MTEEITEKACEISESFLKEVFEKAGAQISLELNKNKDDDNITVIIKGDDASRFIGRNGNTLDSLQYLLSLVLRNNGCSQAKVILDIDGFREKRKKELIEIAVAASERVKAEGMPVSLDPMNPYERRIIHMELQKDSLIKTESTGEEPYRYLIISLSED